ncbi:MAG: hypothetical protein IPO23_12165 [Flavobacterium sp.]|nr:hypothetical protein [Flavobacterium sp.]
MSGSVATNDFDTEGHTQTYTPIDTTDANGNHLVLNSDGTYTFTPELILQELWFILIQFAIMVHHKRAIQQL